MRAKPDMKPWVYTDKSGLSSVGAALTASVWFVAFQSLGKCRPYGAQKWVSMPNPGLSLWGMKMCRPKGLL